MMRKQAFLVALLSLLTWGGVYVAYGQYLAGRNRSARMCQELRFCQQAEAKLTDLHGASEQAMEAEALAGDTIRRIEEAASAAGIAKGKLVSISSEQAQLVGDTPYRRKPTNVLFKDVTLEQLTRCLQLLEEAPEASLSTRRLSLIAPRPEDTSDLWDAEVVLTYLIFAPPETP